jgi:hypothetical protein
MILVGGLLRVGVDRFGVVVVGTRRQKWANLFLADPLTVTVSGVGVASFSGAGVGASEVSAGCFKDRTAAFVSAMASYRTWICARCWS